MNVSKHLYISGRVQGVFFRYSMREEALRIGGVGGWVRNTSDGRVEAFVSGPADKVEQIVRWAYSGPEFARVDDVALSSAGYEDFEDFVIRS